MLLINERTFVYILSHLNTMSRVLGPLFLIKKALLKSAPESFCFFLGVLYRGTCLQLVCPGCHDEIVMVQTLDVVCPPADRHFTPFGQDRRVVAFCLRNFPYPIAERQGRGEILKSVDSF